MKSGAFDIPKARKLADELLDSCAPEDKWFARIAMTLRAACNEVEALRREKQALWIAHALIKNHGSHDHAKLREIAAGAIEEDAS